jgi:predicted phage gp36 major capsid-like protein
LTTANIEPQSEERQDPAQQFRTLPERMAALEAQQRLLIEVVRENGRRSDENYRALDAKAEDAKADANYKALDAKADANYLSLDSKIDANYKALDAKIDRLTYLLLGLAATAAAAFVVQLIF